MTDSRTLAVFTTALDEDGRMVTFPAGMVASAEVAKGITNPKAWGEGDQPEPDSIEVDSSPAPAKRAAKRAPSSKSEK